MIRFAHAFLAAALVAACAGTQAAPITPGSHDAPVAAVAPPAPLATAWSPHVAPASTCNRAVASTCIGTPPSFANEIHPLLERRCFGCHANGGEAADDHDFSRFATLVAQQRLVVAEVSACAMPPAGATPLAEDEAALLLRWVACGAHER